MTTTLQPCDMPGTDISGGEPLQASREPLATLQAPRGGRRVEVKGKASGTHAAEPPKVQASHTTEPGTHAGIRTGVHESRTGEVSGPSRLVSAVAYVRVSTDEQRIGPHAQRDAIEAYAARNGIAIVAWCTDTGVSGATPIADRPALASALEACRVHRASLIVAKRDRVARDVMIAAMVDRSLPRGASVIAADGSGNGSTPADQLMRTILDGMSEYERALIRSRTRAALQAKRTRGERAGRVPYGFEADASGKLHPSEGEQATIARIRTLQASGASHRAIVAALASEGHASRAGTPLGLSQVQRILAASPRP